MKDFYFYFKLGFKDEFNTPNLFKTKISAETQEEAEKKLDLFIKEKVQSKIVHVSDKSISNEMSDEMDKAFDNLSKEMDSAFKKIEKSTNGIWKSVSSIFEKFKK